jgi:hypothetical protein
MNVEELAGFIMMHVFATEADSAGYGLAKGKILEYMSQNNMSDYDKSLLSGAISLLETRGQVTFDINTDCLTLLQEGFDAIERSKR